MPKQSPPKPSDDAIVPLTQLRPDTKNPRRRTARNRALLRQSLKELGAARSIVIDEGDNILSGNGVTEAAQAVGIRRARVIDADGDELIAVRRRNLSPDQKARLKLIDNQTGLLSEWDTDVIAAMREDGVSMDGIFSDDDLDRMLVDPEPVERVELTKPPEMLWILIGVPVERYPDIAPYVERLETLAEISVQTTRDRKRP